MKIFCVTYPTEWEGDDMDIDHYFPNLADAIFYATETLGGKLSNDKEPEDIVISEVTIPSVSTIGVCKMLNRLDWFTEVKNVGYYLRPQDEIRRHLGEGDDDD